MAKHYDTLETRSPEEREKALMAALPQQIAHAKANAPFFATWLKDVDPTAVTSRAALAKLPVLRKSMLGEVQKKHPPMGGLITVPMTKVRHVFMSPGPIFEIDTDEPDYFRGARGDGGRIYVLHPSGEEWCVRLGMRDLLRQRLHQRLLALLGRAGFQDVVMPGHRFPLAFRHGRRGPRPCQAASIS